MKTIQRSALRAVTGLFCSAGLAFATPGAMGAIGVAGDFEDPPAELFLAVHDSALGVTYTRDLGIPAQGTTLINNDFLFEPDALYQMTFAASDPGDLRYSVVGVYDFALQMYWVVFATSNDSNIGLPASPQIAIPAAFQAISNYTSAVNAAAGSADIAENVSVVISDSSSDGFYTNPSTFNENLGAVVQFNTGANIGEPLAFHELGMEMFMDELFQRTFDKQWHLALDGTLSFGLPENPDSDGDGIDDLADNCIETPNAGQQDGDGDGFGNICDTDLSNDCTTNFIDLGLLRTAFFSSDATADFNADGTVNFVDLGIMRSAFFLEPGPSALASCP